MEDEMALWSKLMDIPRYVVHYVGRGDWRIFDRQLRLVVRNYGSRREARSEARQLNLDNVPVDKSRERVV